MNLAPRRHRFRRHKHASLPTWAALAILAMCMVSILSPLASPASAGPIPGLEPATTECPSLQVWDADQGKCVAALDLSTEEETPATVDPREDVIDDRTEETPVDGDTDVTPTPTQMPIDTDVDVIDFGTVIVNKHRCPADFDTSAADYYELAQNCTESPNGILFGVSDGATEIATGTTGDAFPGGFEITGLPLEGTAIYEKDVPAGGTSVIFCDGYADDEGGPSNWENFETDENQIFYDFGEAPNLYCDWFNIVPPTAGSATLILSKRACPDTYDASAEDYYDLALNCPDTADGIEFGVSDGATEIATATTGSTNPGGLQIDGLPAGGTSIYEKAVPDTMYSIVFCDGMLPTDNSPVNFVKMTLPDANQVFYLLQENETLYCDWFNVHTQEPGTATVIINKHGCPAAYDASAEDYYDLALNCHEAADGIEFGVSDGATEIATGTTGSAFPNGLQIDGLPADAVAIYERNVPDGISSVVFCDGKLPTDNGPADFEKMSQLEPNQIFHVLQDHETFYCDWFNVYDMPETDGYGDITIYKWLCPEGFDPSAPGADPGASCTEAMDDVTFTMERPGKDPLVSNTGDSVPGAVQFGGQDAGDYVITETLPQGIESAFVWDCTGASTSWIHDMPLSVGASLEVTIADGDAIVCHWFNVPQTGTESGHLTVYKYACSTTVFVSDVDCEIHEYGVTFDLLAWNGSDWIVADTETTDANGVISWNGLDVGTYSLDELDGEPCHATSTSEDGEGNPTVIAGENTVVKVYNCTAEGETPVTGKPPVKYPNTGVMPFLPAPAGE